MHVIVILQMAEALLVIMDRTFLNSSQNGSKFCSTGGKQRRSEDESCVCIWKVRTQRRDKVIEAFKGSVTLG